MPATRIVWSIGGPCLVRPYLNLNHRAATLAKATRLPAQCRWTEERLSMKGFIEFIRNTRHLWILGSLLAAGGTGLYFARERMIPESYGNSGPYRAAALAELAARPSVMQADSNCLKCHTKVGEERVETLHKAVRCVHCHGLGREHIAEAEKGAKTPGSSITKARPWDGDFKTAIDLYITKDKATCLSCHEAVVGMPKDFHKINSKAHLEEMGAKEPARRETCFECHGPHNTAP
jgi:decaheme cytochrome c component MtrC/MtrF-like protein